MNQNTPNPAIEYMNAAQDEMATYSVLITRAHLFLVASEQAFKRANENSLTADCLTRRQLTAKLQKQYVALIKLTEAIQRTLAEPTLSRMVVTAPCQSPRLPALKNCLSESENLLVFTVLNCLFESENDRQLLSEEQLQLAKKILSLWK